MKPKLSQVFVALTISLFIFLLPPYLRFADLADDHLPFSDLSFENPDDDIPLIGEHKQPKLLASSTFFHISSPQISIFGHIPHLSFLIDPFDPKTPVLRC